MNTTLSSRRSFEPVTGATHLSGNAIAAIAFFAGIVLTVLGVKTDVTLFIGAGFVGIVSALMYWNTNFWAKVYKDKKVTKSYRNNWYV